MYDENSDTGIAIYSNSEYTVMSYDTIFETLWTKAEIKNLQKNTIDYLDITTNLLIS